ncbi:type II toxin-antitoxin system PemK/MazF family toxin [Nocardioides terrisoli]|uniref:type II toxin-antitoxin system PemK/MazF family toxin n=1 Tax=Nocardioides terrisoli TaxID=3388267 RepID=UPI00287BAC9B|nr:type II toxin-antitoxin system PemK/MazF family toxin [Nocardioides marmorisolisilvae]
MIRGAVYRADLGPGRGHEQGGKRYAIVVSPSDMNWSVATVLPTSTSAQASIYRPEIETVGDLTRVLVDQIRTIDVSYLSDEPVEYLTRDQMGGIEHALAHYLGPGYSSDRTVLRCRE